MGWGWGQAHITHPELKCTFNLDIIGVKKNPNGPMYSSMGVITKGTIIEVRILPGGVRMLSCMAVSVSVYLCCVWFMLRRGCGLWVQVNVSELGLVTPAGKVVWGKWRLGWGCYQGWVWVWVWGWGLGALGSKRESGIVAWTSS